MKRRESGLGAEKLAQLGGQHNVALGAQGAFHERAHAADLAGDDADEGLLIKMQHDIGVIVFAKAAGAGALVNRNKKRLCITNLKLENSGKIAGLFGVEAFREFLDNFLDGNHCVYRSRETTRETAGMLQYATSKCDSLRCHG